MRALLCDVGGTLVADNVPTPSEVLEARTRWLGEALPELDREACRTLLGRLSADARESERTGRQVTEEMIARRLAEVDPRLAARAPAVRSAMGRYPGQGADLFPDAAELLADAGRLGLRRILVTNVAWSTADDVRRRLAGRVGYEEAVTSYDVGRRKPDPAMFEAALRAAGCPPTDCLMIGNDERADVEPADRLGMAVIRVAIQEPPPAWTLATRLVTSLAEARSALRQLAFTKP
jgi:FMN phosphatase YigB (HAD superfamily)